jgi:hypothetical protein
VRMLLCKTPLSQEFLKGFFLQGRGRLISKTELQHPKTLSNTQTVLRVHSHGVLA